MSAHCPECNCSHNVDISTHEKYLSNCTCGASCHSDCGCTVEVKCSSCKTNHRTKNRQTAATRKWKRRTGGGRCITDSCDSLFRNKKIYKKQTGICLKCWEKNFKENQRSPKINRRIENRYLDTIN